MSGKLVDPLLKKEDEKTKSMAENLGLENEESEGKSIAPPPFQLKSNNVIQKQDEGEGHGGGEHDHDHDHDHDIENPGHASDEGEGDGTGGEGGVYSPGEKDDRHDQEIPDSDPNIFDRFLKWLYMSRNYGPTNMTPTAGDRGGFSAMLLPRAELLSIYVQAKVNFHSGLQMDPGGSGNVVVRTTGKTSKDSRLQAAADHANSNLDAAGKAAFVASFTWTPQEVTDGMAALNTQLRVVEDLWSYQHSFFVDKDGWRDVRARVAVTINASQGTAVDGADHLSIMPVKTPDDWSRIGATVYSQGDVTTTANQMIIDDDKLSGLNKTNFLHHRINFATGSSELTQDSKDLLDMIIIRHRDDNTRLRADRNRSNDDIDNGVLNKFNLVGHASSVGSEESNETLAGDRIKAVSDYLTAGGLDQAATRIETDNKGEEGATEDESWQRVDVIIGSGERQHTLSHEFGHVFGLQDEYATDTGSGLSGTGSNAGTVVAHDDLATGIGADNATAENNDGIMSMGNEIRGQHYATFGYAIKTLSGISEWKLIT